jgi:RNA polymerase sigma-70 factor, ECF subfamily
MTNEEIAKRLGVTLETVKIRLHRAHVRLKRECGIRRTFYRDERNELACVPKKDP